MKLKNKLNSRDKIRRLSKLGNITIVNNTKYNLMCMLDVLGNDVVIEIEEKKEEKK
jgi:hypothetical protein